MSSASVAASLSSRPELEAWTVPRCWPGATVAILGGGKSLRREDVERLRGRRIKVIAINRAHELCSWAHWLYACDETFWLQHPEALAFRGVRIAVQPARKSPSAALLRLAGAGVHVLRHAGRSGSPEISAGDGASSDPGVVVGNNSLAQVLSVIAHTGASRVLLLGADQRPGHWHEPHPDRPEADYRTTIPLFASLVRPLAAADVDVINCAPGSALPWWPRLSLEEALA